MVAGTHKSFHLPESRPHFPPPLEFHTSHIRVEIEVDFEKKGISGACTLSIAPVKKDLKWAHLDACELDISTCEVDGTRVPFEYDNRTLTLPLDPAKGDHEIRVEYRSTPREGVYFTAPDKEHPDKEVQAWTHCEPESSCYWYPCHDHPSDKPTSELVITVPKGFRVISNGRFLSTKEDGDKATFHWKEEVPHSTYLTSFVVGKFGEMTQDAGGVKLHYNFPESKREDVLRYFGETPKMMEVFNRLTGVKYPYEKYDQTTVQDFIAGGEENLNATTLAMNYYPDASSEEDFCPTYAAPWLTAVNLVAHELAHQWFGDYVTCSDWCHAWVNEGWATYFQSLYIEQTRGPDEMRWEMRAREGEYFEEDEAEYRRPIVERDYVWPHDVFDHTTYRKGAAMLHELRFIVGDESFFRGVNSFLNSFARGCADTDDFRKSMEKASGVPLEEFFQQAFYGPGYPEFRVEYAWDDGAKTATLRVRQVQETGDGTPVFKLPCDVVFYVEGKRRKFRTQLDSADQTLVFTLDSRPSVVEFDPEKWLLKKVKFEKSIDLLQNQLDQSQDAFSRAEAATALGKTGSDRVVGSLKAAASKEQFWDVRACALRALGEVGSDSALDALVGVGVPDHRKVRRALAKALGNFKDERAQKILLSLLEGDQSPFVRCEAALSLAKSMPEGALKHLREAMGVHTVNETLSEACLEAMGKLKDVEAKLILNESLAYGKPTRVRIGALKGIKARGHIDDDELPIIKEILMHDKEFRVRQYLISAVARDLADLRLADTLADVSKMDRNPGIKRQALEVYYDLSATIERSASLVKLKAEVEELKDENRRLARAAS
jgi:aminopeptidase N